MTTLFDWASDREAAQKKHFAQPLREVEKITTPARTAHAAYWAAWQELDDFQEKVGYGYADHPKGLRLYADLQLAASDLRKAAEQAREGFIAFQSQPGRGELANSGLLEPYRVFLFETLGDFRPSKKTRH